MKLSVKSNLRLAKFLLAAHRILFSFCVYLRELADARVNAAEAGIKKPVRRS